MEDSPSKRKTKPLIAFIKKYYFMVVILVVTVLVIGGVMVFVSLNRNRITLQNREYLQNTSIQLASNIDSVISDGLDNIRLLSLLVSDSLHSPKVDIATIQSTIKDSVFNFMEFADTEGVDHNITGGTSDARDRQYYLDAMKGNTGVELIFNSRATHETLLMFYSPVYYDNRIVGSLVGAYQASKRITDLLQTNLFSESIPAYLCTAEGRVIASSHGMESKTEMMISELAQGDKGIEGKIEDTLTRGNTIVLALPGNETGACITKLAKSGYFLVQVFPYAANDSMIVRANSIGMFLAVYIIIVCVIFTLEMALFYRKQQRKLEFANNAKSAFLFNMSHDIRTPMNAIIGYTKMAQKYINDPKKTASMLEKIDVSGKQLLALINQVLDMSRIETGTVELEEVPADIVNCMKALLIIVRPSAELKSIKLLERTSEVNNRFVYADVGRINQILLNILSNAIKYTPEGGNVELEIRELSCEKQGFATYRISVLDTGIGMSPEFLKHIFDRFSREHNSTSGKVEGSGLGMSIVKQLTDIMGGILDIQSEPNEGTSMTLTFTFRLALDPVKTQEPDSAIIKKPERDFSALSLTNKRILLVDDIEMNREIAADMLRDRGMIIETAEDGDEAVQMVDRAPFDYYNLVLMDIQMPRMNGYEATRAIRALESGKGKNLPIIAMTANAFAEDKENAFKAGMNAHLAKPVDMKKILEVFERVGI